MGGYSGDSPAWENLTWSWSPKASHPALHVAEDMEVGHFLLVEPASLWAPTTLKEVGDTE